VPWQTLGIQGYMRRLPECACMCSAGSACAPAQDSSVAVAPPSAGDDGGTQPPPSFQQQRSLLQLFGWRQAANTVAHMQQSISSRLQLAGVSVTLSTRRVLPGDTNAQASQPTPFQGSSVSPVQKPAQPPQFVTGSAQPWPMHGAGGQAAWQQEQREHTGEASRRRKRGRIVVGGGGTPHEATQQGSGPQASQLRPLTEYVILQQWGAEAVLKVLPPGQRLASSVDAQQSAAAAPGGHGMRGDTKLGGGGDASIPSSPGSFRSWSIPANAQNGSGHLNGSASQRGRQGTVTTSSAQFVQRLMIGMNSTPDSVACRRRPCKPARVGLVPSKQ